MSDPISFVGGALIGAGFLFIILWILAHLSGPSIELGTVNKAWVWLNKYEGKAISIEFENGKVKFFFATSPSYYTLELTVDEFEKFRKAINAFGKRPGERGGSE